MSAVQKIEPRQEVAALTPITPMAMLAQAIEKGMAPETIDKLMTLAERFDATQARKAFDAAISAAKAEIPVIKKTAQGHNIVYADLAAIARVVDPIIARHGLSYRYRTTQDEKTIRVTCVLSHQAGHYEENTLCGAPDTGPGRNAIQAIGSSLTYLQRYTLIQALGIAASKDDDGKAAGAGSALTNEQIDQLRSLIVEVGADIPKFCTFMKVERIEDIPQRDFTKATGALEAKRAKS